MPHFSGTYLKSGEAEALFPQNVPGDTAGIYDGSGNDAR
jgi:hypothetical protein